MLLKMSKAARTLGLGAEVGLQLGRTGSPTVGDFSGKTCVWLARGYWFSLFTSFVNVGKKSSSEAYLRSLHSLRSIQIFRPSCGFLSAALTAPIPVFLPYLYWSYCIVSTFNWLFICLSPPTRLWFSWEGDPHLIVIIFVSWEQLLPWEGTRATTELLAQTDLCLNVSPDRSWELRQITDIFWALVFSSEKCGWWYILHRVEEGLEERVCATANVGRCHDL